MGRSDSRHALNDKSRNGTNRSRQYLGKPAEIHGEKSKRTVSTSRIFDKKLTSPRPTRNREIPKASGRVHTHHKVQKTSKALAGKSHHSNKKKVKKGEKYEHPLYHALVENNDEHSAQVRFSVDASLKTSHNALTEHLAANLSATKESVSSQQELKEELYRPLGSEQLALNTTINGVTHTEKVHLGQHAEVFRTFTANKKRELDALWEEWTSVQKQIVALGVEVLGPKAFDLEGHTTAEEVFPTSMIKPLPTPHQASKMEFDRNVHELEEEVRTIGDKTLERLEASEKVMLTVSLIPVGIS
ncbi:MAG: hypothetical protein M1812_006847 [Candelaria pacifica]|nr:MAG: hypothetical protein M1812_006847 [Candelaria pacifica]